VGAAARRELGCGSWSTAYRRFTRWARVGLFDELHLVLLDQLGEAGRLDWRRISVDSVSLRAVKKGSTPAQTPPTAARPAASSTSPSTAAASPSHSC
jgi:transposase